MSVLKAENVTYVYQSKYQQVKALDGVSCDFEAGKFYAIVGQSGSGKTTLLSMLAGLGTPNDGQVVANGQSVKEFGSERHRRENVSVIYQAFNLFPSLNILENVMYPMMIQKAQAGKAKARAKELLAAVGLEEVDPRKLPAMLSGGQQQRVAIARALAAKPAILLADEPTGNLDSRTSQDVLGLLKVTGERFGQTIVMITHNEEIAQLADRIVRIEDGQIVRR